jgi:hypothetical protein
LDGSRTADLAVWGQYPNAVFTLFRTVKVTEAAGEDFLLGTFELQKISARSETPTINLRNSPATSKSTLTNEFFCGRGRRRYAHVTGQLFPALPTTAKPSRDYIPLGGFV